MTYHMNPCVCGDLFHIHEQGSYCNNIDCRCEQFTPVTNPARRAYVDALAANERDHRDSLVQPGPGLDEADVRRLATDMGVPMEKLEKRLAKLGALRADYQDYGARRQAIEAAQQVSDGPTALTTFEAEFRGKRRDLAKREAREAVEALQAAVERTKTWATELHPAPVTPTQLIRMRDKPTPTFDPTLLHEGYAALAREGQHELARRRKQAEAEADATLERIKAVAAARHPAEELAKAEADKVADEILAAGQRTPPAWDPLGAAPFAWDLPEPKAPVAHKTRRQRAEGHLLSLVYLACALLWYAMFVLSILSHGPVWLWGSGLIVGSIYAYAAGSQSRRSDAIRNQDKEA
jgi:hypothetical protein